MVRRGKFIARETVAGDIRANRFRHGRVVAEEPQQFERVVFVRLPDLRPLGRRCRGPGVRRADQAHRELFPDAVVHVDLVAGERIEIDADHARIPGVLQKAARQFKARRIVGRRLHERHAIRRVLRHRDPPAIGHDMRVAFIRTGAFARHQRQQFPLRIAGRKRETRLLELLSRQGFVVPLLAFASDDKRNLRRGQQIALVAGIDKFPRGKLAVVRLDLRMRAPSFVAETSCCPVKTFTPASRSKS